MINYSLKPVLIALLLSLPIPTAIYLGASWHRATKGDIGTITFTGIVAPSSTLAITEQGGLLFAEYSEHHSPLVDQTTDARKTFLAHRSGFGAIGPARIWVKHAKDPAPRRLLAERKAP